MHAPLKSSRLQPGINHGGQIAFLYRKQAVVRLAWSRSRHTESSPGWRQILMQPSGVVRPRRVTDSGDLHLDDKAVDTLDNTTLCWVLHRKESGFHP